MEGFRSLDAIPVKACMRLIAEDRKELLNAAEQAVFFADKQIAHLNPTFAVRTTFNDLDQTIHTES